jgi:hypothetical protein
MRFEARSVGRVNIPRDKCIVLNHARLRGEDYSGRDLLQFATVGSRLEGCRFDKVCIESASFGSGRETSEYIECTFDGAHLDMAAGGNARFIRCSFRDILIRDWFCFAVELVDCTFSGQMRKCVFNGAVPRNKRSFLGRDRNEFHGNDFSTLDMFDVMFRTGIDLTQQRLPSAPCYLYLPDAVEALERSRAVVVGWKNPQLRRPALVILNGLLQNVREGQRQLFLRMDNYLGLSSIPDEAVEKVFALLRGESG